MLSSFPWSVVVAAEAAQEVDAKRSQEVALQGHEDAQNLRSRPPGGVEGPQETPAVRGGSGSSSTGRGREGQEAELGQRAPLSIGGPLTVVVDVLSDLAPQLSDLRG